MKFFNYSPERVRQAKIIDEKEKDFYQPNEALAHGNASKSLYDPYKNYKVPVVIPDNNLLLKLQTLNFILVDLGLYLDTHPDDVETIKLYRNYLLEYRNALDKFEKNNYPLTLQSINLQTSYWDWVNNWKVKGGLD